MLPATIHDDVRSGGERRIFKILRDAPGTDRWFCLHSLGLACHAYKRRAEIDFLLITGNGVFVLEVKAGRVSRRQGEWIFTDRYGREGRRTESPFDQASSAMFALEKEIRRQFAPSSRLGKLLFGYGVLFPDIEFDSCGIEGDRTSVYDVRDRARPFGAYIDRLTRFTQSTQKFPRLAPTVSDAEELVTFLRGDFDVIPPLRIQADDTSQEMLRLTTEQYGVLDALAGRPRCMIQGSACTGKTVLAIEAARREAREGRHVLFLCFNRLLATYLASILGRDPSGPSVQACGVYQFFDRLIRSSTLEGEFGDRQSVMQPDELYERAYPEYAALAALEAHAASFDCLVVDEAQDMMTHVVLDVLDSVLQGGLEAGRWRFFLDANNQAAVYGKFDHAALDRLRRFGDVGVLSVNCRNTKPIGNETAMLTRPDAFANARVDGQAVQYAWYMDRKLQVDQLLHLLRDLASRHATPGSVTVLSPRNAADCCAHDLEKSGSVQIEAVTEANVLDVASGRYPHPTYCSVSSFKGLENDFIVLTDIEDLDAVWWRSVVYVGMSRARVGLYVMLHESLRAVYESRLRSWLQARQGLSAEQRAYEQVDNHVA
jgi:hypothetical protein